MMLCPKCGQQNLDDARFCANCGASLEPAPPAPPKPAAPARSPLEGLSSPAEAAPAPETSFAVSKQKAPGIKPEPAPVKKETAAAPPPPPPPPPPTDVTPAEKKADVSPPQEPAPVKEEAAAAPPPPPPPPVAAAVETPVTSPPPPYEPEAGAAPTGAAKSQKKAVVVCCSIVGILALLFLLLVVAGMCMGNTATSRLSGPGDSYVFTVDVSEPVNVTFEVPQGVQFNVNITGPQGDFVGDWTINPYNNVFTLQRLGTYTLTVYSVSGAGSWKAKW